MIRNIELYLWNIAAFVLFYIATADLYHSTVSNCSKLAMPSVYEDMYRPEVRGYEIAL